MPTGHFVDYEQSVLPAWPIQAYLGVGLCPLLQVCLIHSPQPSLLSQLRLVDWAPEYEGIFSIDGLPVDRSVGALCSLMPHLQWDPQCDQQLWGYRTAVLSSEHKSCISLKQSWSVCITLSTVNTPLQLLLLFCSAVLLLTCPHRLQPLGSQLGSLRSL